jgi:hypothetical protein
MREVLKAGIAREGMQLHHPLASGYLNLASSVDFLRYVTQPLLLYSTVAGAELMRVDGKVASSAVRR